MKLNAKLNIGMLAASVLIGSAWMTGCEKAPVAAPSETSAELNGAEISVVDFTLTKPYYYNSNAIFEQGQEVAVLRLKIKAVDREIKYAPLHNAKGQERIQIWSKADIDKENIDVVNPKNSTFGRVPLSAYTLASGAATFNQITAPTVTIEQGSEIIDEYLFHAPNIQDLYAIIPGKLVGGSNEARIVLPNPHAVPSPTLAGLNQTVTFEDVSIKVTKVAHEYAELAPRNPPVQPLKYPYAYSANPVLAVYVTITNNNKTHEFTYTPNHSAATDGVHMSVGTEPLKRNKIGTSDITGKQVAVIVKGQVDGATTLKPGDTINDVYLFAVPTSNVELSFDLSGSLFRTKENNNTRPLKGYYRFTLPYKTSTPAQPDLEPYKHADQAGNAEDDADQADDVEENVEQANEEKEDSNGEEKE